MEDKVKHTIMALTAKDLKDADWKELQSILFDNE